MTARKLYEALAALADDLEGGAELDRDALVRTLRPLAAAAADLAGADDGEGDDRETIYDKFEADRRGGRAAPAGSAGVNTNQPGTNVGHPNALVKAARRGFTLAEIEKGFVFKAGPPEDELAPAERFFADMSAAAHAANRRGF